MNLPLVVHGTDMHGKDFEEKNRFDMGGGVDQWVEDCWHRNYQGAPTDGSAWGENECPSHVIRSGSWRNDSNYARASNRGSYDTNVRYPTHGFRVALSP